jgi:hypothetical protein
MHSAPVQRALPGQQVHLDAHDVHAVLLLRQLVQSLQHWRAEQGRACGPQSSRQAQARRQKARTQCTSSSSSRQG